MSERDQSKRSRWIGGGLISGPLLALFVSGYFALAEATDPEGHWELRGTVVTEAGTPVGGALVTIHNNPVSKAVATASDGRFSLDVPNPPSWGGFLLAADSGGERQAIYVPHPDWRDPTQRRPLRLVLKKAAAIPVTVNDGQGHPVAGAIVAACAQMLEVAKETSDSAGRAVLRFPADVELQSVFAVKPEIGLDYFACASPGSRPGNPYLLPRGDRRPLKLVLNGAKTAKLRFTDANYRPLAGVRVVPWYFQRPRKGAYLNFSGMEAFTQTTDAKGVATFSIIPSDNEGVVPFTVTTPEYAVPNRPVFDPKGISRVIAQVLPRKELLHGSVSFPDGKPAAGADVAVSGEGYGTETFGKETNCDARGQFELRVDPDMFYVFVATHGSDVSPRQTQVVRAGESIPPVKLALQPGTRIHGRWTLEADNRPLKSRSFALDEWVINNDYAAIPEDRRIPNPRNLKKMLLPKVLRWAKTDEQGRYEIYVTSGTYYLAPNYFEGKVPYMTAAIGRKDSVVEITDQEDFELNFQSQPKKLREISGRVVLRSDLARGVPDVSIEGLTTDKAYFTYQLRAVSDSQGSFRQQCSPCALVLYAATENRSLSAIVRVTADAGKVVIPLGPTASAHGRLIDRATGEPLANRAIRYGIPWTWQASFSWRFGGQTKTDAHGEFTVKNLTPDWRWELLMDEDGAHVIGGFTPQSPERVELGDLKR